MDRILRIIDANFNRAREGLRVIEDALRFYYEVDSKYLRALKKLRHCLAKETADNFTLKALREARDSEYDIGKKIDMRELSDVRKTVEKNFLRVGEALRAIEEYSKSLNPESSAIFHNMRFELYKIEKEVSEELYRKNFPLPFLYLIVDYGIESGSLRENIGKACGFKPDFIEIRFNGLTDIEILEAAKNSRRIIKGRAIYIINARMDICAAAGAEGISLSRRDIPCKEIKKFFPEKITVFNQTDSDENLPDENYDYMILRDENALKKNAILTKSSKKVNIPSALMVNKTGLINVKSLAEKGFSGIACELENFCSYAREGMKEIKDYLRKKD